MLCEALHKHMKYVKEVMKTDQECIPKSLLSLRPVPSHPAGQLLTCSVHVYTCASLYLLPPAMYVCMYG